MAQGGVGCRGSPSPLTHSVHSIWPLHHVHRHGEAAGETPGKVPPPPREAPPGVLVSLSCGAAWPPSSRGVTRVPCSWLRAHPQLLEDLDEQLSCTRFEEAAVSLSLIHI